MFVVLFTDCGGFSFKGFGLGFLVVLILSMLAILVVRWWSSWMFGVGGLGLFVGVCRC